MTSVPGDSGGLFARLVPAITFLVGVVLGGVGVAITLDADDRVGTPAAETSASPDETAASDIEVTIPAACREASDQAEQIVELLRDAVAAVRNREFQTVIGLLQDLEVADGELRALAAECEGVDFD